MEIERERRALSMLILFSTIGVEWSPTILIKILRLMNRIGIWVKELIMEVEREGIVVKKAKHSRKSIKYRAQSLKGKLT